MTAALVVIVAAAAALTVAAAVGGLLARHQTPPPPPPSGPVSHVRIVDAGPLADLLRMSWWDQQRKDLP